MIVAACRDGGDGTEASPDGPTPTPIVYQVRGVYPPFLHRAVIGPDGRAVITSRSVVSPGGTRRRIVEVPEKQLTEIWRELASVDLASIDDEGPRTCADCPEYTVEFDGERVELFAVNVPKRLRPAIRPLKQALRRASQPHDHGVAQTPSVGDFRRTMRRFSPTASPVDAPTP